MQALVCANCGAPLPAPDPGAAVITCTYCDHAHESLAGPAAPMNPDATFVVGDAVTVEWGGRWWPGTIKRVVMPDLWEVHYDGWSDEWDEILGPDRVRGRGEVPVNTGRGLPVALVAVLLLGGLLVVIAGVMIAGQGTAGPSAEPETIVAERAPITPTGVPIPEGLLLPAGANVEVSWNESWYRATVLREHPDGSLAVHYTGWSDSFDETVEAARVRVPQETLLAARGPITPRGAQVTAESIVHPGDVLEVQWRDAVYRAVAVTELTVDGVRVHYSGWEDSWDETVPVARIRTIEYD